MRPKGVSCPTCENPGPHRRVRGYKPTSGVNVRYKVCGVCETRFRTEERVVAVILVRPRTGSLHSPLLVPSPQCAPSGTVQV